MNKKLIALWLPVLIVVIADQVTKHLVRTTPALQDLNIIPGWLAFHYTQNPGMALVEQTRKRKRRSKKCNIGKYVYNEDEETNDLFH